jgi:hypothetical protein
MYAAPMVFLLLIFKLIQLDTRRAKKKYDIDGSAALNSTDGHVEVVETADCYNTDSGSGSDDSDSDSDSDSDDDK